MKTRPQLTREIQRLSQGLVHQRQRLQEGRQVIDVVRDVDQRLESFKDEVAQCGGDGQVFVEGEFLDADLNLPRQVLEFLEAADVSVRLAVQRNCDRTGRDPCDVGGDFYRVDVKHRIDAAVENFAEIARCQFRQCDAAVVVRAGSGIGQVDVQGQIQANATVVRRRRVFLQPDLQEVAERSGDVRIIKRGRHRDRNFRQSVLHQIEPFIHRQSRPEAESYTEAESRIDDYFEVASGCKVESLDRCPEVELLRELDGVRIKEDIEFQGAVQSGSRNSEVQILGVNSDQPGDFFDQLLQGGRRAAEAQSIAEPVNERRDLALNRAGTDNAERRIRGVGELIGARSECHREAVRIHRGNRALNFTACGAAVEHRVTNADSELH